jgi:hypothetical protein
MHLIKRSKLTVITVRKQRWHHFVKAFLLSLIWMIWIVKRIDNLNRRTGMDTR